MTSSFHLIFKKLFTNDLVLYCTVYGGLCPRMPCKRRLIVQTLIFSRSYLHRQVSPPETLAVKGGTTWARNGRWILPENARLPRNIHGSLTCRKSVWEKRLYFPSEGWRAEDFFPWKIRRLRPGLNPRTWVPKASTLPLDHRTRSQMTLQLDLAQSKQYYIGKRPEYLSSRIGRKESGTR